MAKDTQRDKARAVFGKTFFDNTKERPAPKNSMTAQQKVANSRPIPTFKVGGIVKKAPEGNVEAAARRAIRAEQDFSKPMKEAANRAAMKGTPVMKQGGATDEYTAKRVSARIEAGNFKKGGKVSRKMDGGGARDVAASKVSAAGRYADGGSARDRERMDRKMADIEKDYKIALAKGKNESIAKAKYEQRLADAKDDFAKWTKADRTATRAAEKASEATLSEARKTKGLNILKRDSDAALRKRMEAEANTPIAVPKVDLSGLGTMPKIEKPAPARRAQVPVRRQAQPSRAERAAAPAPRAAARPAADGSAAVAKVGAALRGQAGPAAPAARAKAPAKPSQPQATTNAQRMRARADEIERGIAGTRALEEAPTGTKGAAWARMKNLVGFGSSGDERTVRSLRQMATNQERQDRTRQATLDANAAERRAADQARAKARAETIAAGKRPGATGFERSRSEFYEKYPNALKKGGAPVKKAVGGAGKTRKGMVKGK